MIQLNFFVINMFRISYMHHEEYHIVHAVLYGMFFMQFEGCAHPSD